MKPWETLKDLLVHPKDKQDKEDKTKCVYMVPCANCDKMYVGETGRKQGYMNIKRKLSPRPNKLLPEASALPV